MNTLLCQNIILENGFMKIFHLIFQVALFPAQ